MKQAETAADAENVEQSQETISSPNVVPREQLDGVHRVASQLIDELRSVPDGDLVGEIVANALKLLRDQTNRGDDGDDCDAAPPPQYRRKVKTSGEPRRR